MGSRRLTQQFVDGLAWNETRQFIRDAELKGLVLVVNRGGASFVVQRDLWRGPRGRRRLLGTRRVLLGRTDAVSLKEARDRARGVIARMVAGEEPNAEQRAGGVTLHEALRSFLDWQARKNRQPRTIEHNRYTVTRYLADWLDTPLADIGDDRQGVRTRHVEITERHGYAAANNAMKCLRAIYRRERRANPRLPECPVFGEDLNADKKRTRFVSADALPAWRERVEAIGNPVRKCLQFFLLLSGMRRTAACEARWEHFDPARRVLRVPRPKGGETRAFDLPLSTFLLELLRRRREENEILHPGSPWIFPSSSKSGHITAPKQRGLPSPHMLRHTYATHARAAGVPKSDLRVLLNHASGDVTDGYIHEQGLLDRLIEQQERISAYLLEHLNKPVTKNDACSNRDTTHQQEVTP